MSSKVHELEVHRLKSFKNVICFKNDLWTSLSCQTNNEYRPLRGLRSTVLACNGLESNIIKIVLRNSLLKLYYAFQNLTKQFLPTKITIFP